jgi:hypothetical protein
MHSQYTQNLLYSNICTDAVAASTCLMLGAQGLEHCTPAAAVDHTYSKHTRSGTCCSALTIRTQALAPPCKFMLDTYVTTSKLDKPA